MSLVSNSIKVKEPDYFHRDYKNDLKIDDPKKAPETVNLGLRVAKAALPFVALYKPAGSALSVIMGGCRAISNASQTYQAYSEGKGRLKIAGELLHTTVAVVSVGCAFFALPLGMLVTTCHDLAMNCIHLHQAWYEKDPAKAREMAREAGLQILTNAVYLGLFFTASLQVLVASIALQILVGLYQTSGEFQKGNYLEVGAGLLMIAVRMNQMAKPVSELHAKWKAETLAKKMSVLRAIEENNTAKSEIIPADQGTGRQVVTTQGSKHALIEVLNKYGKNNIPALHNAVRSNDLNAVKVLVENGSDINFSANSVTPVICAIQAKNLEMLKYLHSNGALLDAKVVEEAVVYGDLKGLNYILENGAPLPKNSGELLYNILINIQLPDRIGIAKALIRSGADCSYTYPEFFPLDPPTKRGNTISVQLGLLSRIEDMHRVDLELIKLLVEGGAPINYAMSDALSKFSPGNPNNESMRLFAINFNPLYRAVCQRNEEISAYLISKGALFTEVHQKRLQEQIIRFHDYRVLVMMIKIELLHSSQIQPLFDIAISWPFNYANSSPDGDAQFFIVKELFKRGALVRDDHIRQVLKSHCSKNELIAWLLDHGAKP